MLDIVKCNPFSLFPRVDFDRFFCGPSFTDSIAETKVKAPKVDVTEDECNFFIKAEVPGFNKDEVTLHVEDGRLSLKAEHKEEKEEKEENYHLRERRYGSFVRTFILPDDADGEKVAAQVKDGLLTITIPKREEVKPKRIEVAVH
jgi:HSP20 family protein